MPVKFGRLLANIDVSYLDAARARGRKLKAEAAETLANFGLTVSDAVRILLTRVTKEGGLPPHQRVMADAQAIIDRKRCARS